MRVHDGQMQLGQGRCRNLPLKRQNATNLDTTIVICSLFAPLGVTCRRSFVEVALR